MIKIKIVKLLKNFFLTNCIFVNNSIKRNGIKLKHKIDDTTKIEDKKFVVLLSNQSNIGFNFKKIIPGIDNKIVNKLKYIKFFMFKYLMYLRKKNGNNIT